ncbi:(2Fe-2S)-binding protein [Streptacidiphilus sp. MAP5-3]|uniref:(2Fe-2S)-binding protein n=1 Tax=Streptacidiphilus sp. MAP5-3 TaxID=3156265 RepID=UPI003518B740
MTDYLTTPVGSGDDSPRASYTLRVNGIERPVADAWIGESLLYVLRERLGLAGAKSGCDQGECGACSVQVDGQLTAACLVPAALAAGVEVRTVEGLAEEGVPSDVQQALAESGAVQCGFCAPGLAMAVHDLLERNHHPSELESRQALCGNLCRCTGYQGALAAVRTCAKSRAEAAEEDSPETATTGGDSGFFGDGPVEGVVDAASPVEELVPLPIPESMPEPPVPSTAEAEYAAPEYPGYGDAGAGYPAAGYTGAEYRAGEYAATEYPGYGEAGAEYAAGAEYTGAEYAAAEYAEPAYGDADGEAELPVYVDADVHAEVHADVPAQHGGYDQATYQGAGQDGYGYEGYGETYQDVGQGGQGSHSGHSGHGDGVYGGDGHVGQAPYQGGPFAAPFPGRADGPDARGAAGALRTPGQASAPAEENFQAGEAEGGARRVGAVLGAGLMAKGIADRQRAAGADSQGLGTHGLDAQGPEDTGAFGAFAGLNPDSTGAFRIDVQRGEPTDGAAGAVAVDAPPAPAATRTEAYEQYPAGEFDTGQFHVGQFDTGTFDASAFQAGHFEPGHVDTGSFATGHFEAGTFETGQYDAAAYQTGQFDTSHLDTSHLGTGHLDTGQFPADEFGAHGPGAPDPAAGMYVLPHQHGQESGS